MSKKNPLLQYKPSRGVFFLVGFILFVLLLTFAFGERGIIEIVRVKKEIRRLENSINHLEAEKKSLENEVVRLRRNPIYIDLKAREKLWLMKKNEKVVVLTGGVPSGGD